MIYSYANFNLGDDLFIKLLCERYPNTQFGLYAPKRYKSIFKDLDNIVIHPRDSIFYAGLTAILKIFKINISIRKLIAMKYDAVVHIGGSIFMQSPGWEKRIKHRKKVYNKPFFLLGANFGPFTDEKYYRKYKEIIKEYTDVCFRDQQSYEMFKDLGNVRVSSDIIFQLENDNEGFPQKKTVLISVIMPSKREGYQGVDEKYYEKIRDIAVNFIQKGYEIILMSFCEKEGDEEAVNTIYSLIPSKLQVNVKKHYYRENIDKTLNIIKVSSFIIATRFHSMILGWVYNKPVYPIVYSEKMTNVMKNVGFNGGYVELKEINKLNQDEVVDSLLKNKLINISYFAKDAENHFIELDKYLK